MQTVLAKPEVYELSRSSQVSLMYGKILFININNAIGERILQDLSNNEITEEELLKEEGVISIDNIDSLVSVDNSSRVTLYYVLSEGTTLLQIKDWGRKIHGN
ncbi:hypothetical protein D3C77_507580 [compost metagenome]